MAWRTATAEDGPELLERSGPELSAQPSAVTIMGPEATSRPSEINRRSDAGMKEGRRRGTAVANANNNPWVTATYGLIIISPVVKDLERP